MRTKTSKALKRSASPIVAKGPAAQTVSPKVEPEVIDVDVIENSDIDAITPESIISPELPEVLPAVAAIDLVEVESELEESEQESSSTAIVPYDPLSAYLREIRRIPRMSREEEHALALDYHNNKTVEAAYKLISSNLWLVVKLAREYERAARNLLDLIQEGNIGLMEAVKNFDPYRGVRFPSYATWWVKAYIVRFLINNWRLVKIGTTQAQRKLFFNLNRERQKLEREGFYPAPKLLAERLNVRESDVIEMEQRLGSGDLSVDAPLDGDTDSSLLSLLAAPGENAEDQLASRQMKQALLSSLDEFSKQLNAKEATIFKLRLISEERATLQDLADKLNISCERVRQIENRIKDKLKEFITERMGSQLDSLRFE